MLKGYIDRMSREDELDDMIHEEDRGLWTFFVNERTSARLTEQDQTITFSCDLGPAPSKLSDLEDMLNSNLAGRGTMGSVLALDQLGQKSILWHQLPNDADYEWFRNEFEDFVNNAEYWSYFVRGEQIPKNN